MKSLLSSLLCITTFTVAAPAALAQHSDKPASPTAEKPAAPADAANYPLKVCAVSSEELGSMGDPFDYIHKEEGKPDRLVRMCCEGCVKKFKKDPAKYLGRIDAAKASADAKK